MAILDDKQVLALFNEKSKPIEAMKEEHKKLLMHVHGVGVAEYLTKVEGLENELKVSIRKRLARSNKDLFADILRPTDKIFNSQGGLKTYSLKDKSEKEALADKLSQIYEGNSLSQWLGMYFIDKLTVDPNGLFFIEHKDNEPYPTYKSIATIRNYKVKGRKVEWVIFEPFKVKTSTLEKELFRMYDDSGDYIFEVNNGSITRKEIGGENPVSFQNPWGYVPAITCSDLVNTLTNYKKSTIYEQVELADEFLRENSVKTLFKYHHGFPMFWQYMTACQHCKGTGFIDGKECPVCKGTKYATKKDVSDVTYLRQPESKDDPTVAPDLAGYVVPPIESWKQMTEELKLMRDMIYFSHWGTIINREDKEKTAYEVAINTQPMQDRLNKYTDSLEQTERMLVDIIGEYYYGQSYEGCSINYGRNYIVKSPNQYLTEYLEEKSKNASYSVLNPKLEMYYNALYANDELSRIYHIKLMYVEPWVHNTITEVLGWNIGDTAAKLYYNDWVSKQKKEDIITKDIATLQKELEEYAEQEYKPKKVKDDTKKVQ